MRYTIQAPERRFNGQVAGVAFADGRAEVDGVQHARALAYFRRKGYTVTSDEPAGPAKPDKYSNKADMVTYAVDVLGMSEDEANGKTRAELLAIIDKEVTP